VYQSGDVWLYRDHGADRAGNAYDFLVYEHGMTKGDAAAEIKFRSGVTSDPSPPKRMITATYDYTDADGKLLFQAIRFSPKGFAQRQPTQGGGWEWTLKGIEPVLFNLPNVRAARVEGVDVHVVEGEKDVGTLEVLGKVGTCNPMGAGKWHSRYSEDLEGANVVLHPDNDQTGCDHMRAAALSLEGKVLSLRIVSLPGLEPKGDVSDWIEGGKTAADLDAEIAKAERWTPSAAEGFVSFVKRFLGETVEKNNLVAPEEKPGSVPWGPMLELPATAPSVPTLPSALVPTPLRAWVDDAAERACVHREFIAVPALVSAGALIGRSVAIHPKKFDAGWKVVGNLWGAVVGPPSVLKTMAIDEGTLPLRRLAVEAREAFEEAEAEREAEKEVLKLEIANLKRTAGGKKGSPTSIRDELVRLMRELHDKEQGSAEKRYLTNDATIEKLGELLRENPRGLVMVRDELVGFLKTLDKPGRENERPFYLEAWNGTGSHSIDRIGRGSLFVPALTLSVLGGIQPGKLLSYIYGALEGEDQADGFLQRFQLLVWPDHPPAWVNIDRYADTAAKNRAFEIYRGLDDLDTTTLGLDTQDSEIPALHFADDAQVLFDAWRDELMHRIRTPECERTPAYQAHLAKYPSLFASLALIFHLIDVVDSKAAGGVALGAAELALQWCAYLEEHAKKVYAPELNTTALAAHALAEKIKAGEIDDATPLRDVYRRQWAALKTPEQVGDAIATLERCGWVRLDVVEPGPKGGRPSETLRLHPDLRGA
jgi:putative DNA primase/helicase